MRYSLLMFGCGTLLASAPAHAQSVEASVHLTGGGFNFRGPSAVRESILIRSYQPALRNYTNNPYGALPGFSYGGAVQVQRVTRGHVLLGLQAGYERLRSRVKLVLIGAPTDDNLGSLQGQTYLNHDFVNVHPFVGRRFGLGGLDVDLTAGADLGILLHCQEQGRATASNGDEYTTDLSRPQPRLDFRPRLDLTTYYHRVGLSLGHAHGLTNYRRDWVGGPNEAYAQVWRAGVVYRLR